MSDTPDSLRADVEAIVAAFQASDCTELHIRFPGFELHLAAESPDLVERDGFVQRPPAASLAASGAVPGPASVAPAAPVLAGATLVRAPYLGIFYRAPKPGEAPYVTLGQIVEAGTDLCLIEVMKLFTAVRATESGTIAQILVEDGAMVEADQPLFAIAPAA